jgi:DNA-binding MarR family transcriptional regulator
MDRRLFFLFTKAQKRLFRNIDAVCEDRLDASVTQLAALMMIARQPGMQQKDLAEALELNKSAITGLVNRMEKNGLLERCAVVSDARAVSLKATSEGLEKMSQLMPLIAQMNEVFSSEFSDEEMTVVLRFLNFIIDRF